MKLRRPKLVELGIIAAATLVVVLLGLIGAGYLILPQTTPSPITIVGTQYTILEERNSSGGFWFGPDTLSYPGVNGYPTSVPPGSSFGVPIVLWNHDNASHTIYSVSVQPPFRFGGSDPPVPIPVPAGEDDANFVFTIYAPSDAGASLNLSITINALTST